MSEIQSKGKEISISSYLRSKPSCTAALAFSIKLFSLEIGRLEDSERYMWNTRQSMSLINTFCMCILKTVSKILIQIEINDTAGHNICF